MDRGYLQLQKLKKAKFCYLQILSEISRAHSHYIERSILYLSIITKKECVVFFNIRLTLFSFFSIDMRERVS